MEYSITEGWKKKRRRVRAVQKSIPAYRAQRYARLYIKNRNTQHPRYHAQASPATARQWIEDFSGQLTLLKFMKRPLGGTDKFLKDLDKEMERMLGERHHFQPFILAWLATVMQERVPYEGEYEHTTPAQVFKEWIQSLLYDASDGYVKRDKTIAEGIVVMLEKHIRRRCEVAKIPSEPPEEASK